MGSTINGKKPTQWNFRKIGTKGKSYNLPKREEKECHIKSWAIVVGPATPTVWSVTYATLYFMEIRCGGIIEIWTSSPRLAQYPGQA